MVRGACADLKLGLKSEFLPPPTTFHLKLQYNHCAHVITVSVNSPAGEGNAAAVALTDAGRSCEATSAERGGMLLRSIILVCVYNSRVVLAGENFY